ncbi:recombinase family protein, partial [Micromonospora sp. CPCC 206061]|uniref:recombinase family protein n=1 Tax=Micromonospora sp. CPCC 206061 TaxID=3122410 RepID=UPI002FF249D2
MRDALYARISEDDLGTEKGVFRQLEDGRGLSAARGGEVVAEFSDNDVSALKGVHRPGYEALMAAVAAGQVDRIIVFHTSRLWRNRRELPPVLRTPEVRWTAASRKDV